MVSIIDPINNTIQLPDSIPARVVSLVPSHSETLIDMGVELVGRTKFCIHPSPEISKVKIIGGTKNPRLEDIIKLQPDLIVANKEENKKDDVEYLRQYTQVYTSDINNLEDSSDFINDMGSLLRKKDISEKLITQFNTSATEISDHGPEISALYLIWKNPWMTIGGDTYIHDILSRSGFRNGAEHLKRYPSLTEEEIRECRPDVILLSSEPFPFDESHLDEIRVLFPCSKLCLVDGEIFSWYGTRFFKKSQYLQALKKKLNAKI